MQHLSVHSAPTVDAYYVIFTVEEARLSQCGDLDMQQKQPGLGWDIPKMQLGDCSHTLSQALSIVERAKSREL